ncbi:hypothetical protein [Nocardia goodfellowii]|uniref:Uncharacterized protein n=1 Tax=Nocardia goodfellowii TaxID=882446 RepID=A0ABS4QRG9_9NOCA|nr:hypothetical protein [Nocardia goodfellowii]MBP2194290.1 hypothetical protein [Nocardia goodfellowii]
MNTIPKGNGNQTVDLTITNPDGSTTNSRVAGNGEGGWQRWNNDSTGTASYSGKENEGAPAWSSAADPTNDSSTLLYCNAVAAMRGTNCDARGGSTISGGSGLLGVVFALVRELPGGS